MNDHVPEEEMLANTPREWNSGRCFDTESTKDEVLEGDPNVDRRRVICIENMLQIGGYTMRRRQALFSLFLVSFFKIKK